jgi:hypothetical protein
MEAVYSSEPSVPTHKRKIATTQKKITENRLLGKPGNLYEITFLEKTTD